MAIERVILTQKMTRRKYYNNFYVFLTLLKILVIKNVTQIFPKLIIINSATTSIRNVPRWVKLSLIRCFEKYTLLVIMSSGYGSIGTENSIWMLCSNGAAKSLYTTQLETPLSSFDYRYFCTKVWKIHSKHRVSI